LKWAVKFGDCRAVLKNLKSNSVDAVCTDPPYGFGFMGKDWDRHKTQDWFVSCFEPVFRVMKPGAHLLSFGGPRTYHRLGSALEDCGFEIRDSIHWIFATGFPKSLDLGGGAGTALKPAHEPIILARKPPEGTVIANFEKWGTGGLWIDECRVPFPPGDDSYQKGIERAETPRADFRGGRFHTGGAVGRNHVVPSGMKPEGRWPTNLAMGPEAMEAAERAGVPGHFFPTFKYETKPTRDERDAGLDDLPEKTGGELTGREDGAPGTQSPRAGAGRTSGGKNTHPTVKPINLMRWLVRLIARPGQRVLDPFCGSGSTGCACLMEEMEFLGIDDDQESVMIAKKRIAYWGSVPVQRGLF
jgi:site-specific DNA-methyltransferase (adenine-specific)